MDESLRVAESVLALASGSAQVWAGLMVFYVLLLRDIARERKERFHQLRDEAVWWWKDLYARLRNLEGFSRLQGAVTWEQVQRAETDPKCFSRLIDAIDRSKAASGYGNYFKTPENDVSSERLQAVLSSIAEQVRECNEFVGSPLAGYWIGIAAIVFNLAALVLFTNHFLAEPRSLLGAIWAVNIVLGALFIVFSTKALHRL